MRAFFVNHRGIAIIGAIVFLLGVLRLNDLSLSGDSCRYITWGTSLAHGKGFVDPTQPEPDHFVPLAPLYSVLIAPIELFFPMSLIPVKIFSLGCAAAALILFYFSILRLAGKRAAIWSSILLGLNPAMLVYGTEALSEMPFIVLSLLLLTLADRIVKPEALSKRGFLSCILLLALLPLLREAGIAMALALLLVLISRGRVKRAIAATAAIALLPGSWYFRNQILVSPKVGQQLGNMTLLFRHFLTPSETPFPNELALRIATAVQAYAGQVGGLIFYPGYAPQLSGLIAAPSGLFTLTAVILDTGKYLALVACVPLIWIGVTADLKKSPSGAVRALYCLLYMAALCLYPAYDIRFLLPMLPLALYYVAGGVAALCSREIVQGFIHTRWAVPVAAFLLAFPNLVALHGVIATNLGYVRSPSQMATRAVAAPIFKAEWSRVAEWIASHTPETAIIGTPVRDVALVSAGRKVAVIDPAVTVPVFDSFFRDAGVGFLLDPPQWHDLRQYEFLMRVSRRFWFEAIPDAPNLYKVHSRFAERAPAAVPEPPASASEAVELLRKGRNEIMGGAYRQAASDLHKALGLAPDSPDLLYHAMHADLFTGDSGAARSEYQVLMSQPLSLSYAGGCRNQLDAADVLSEVRTSTSAPERSIKTLRAAMIYWRTGYYRRASEIMDGMIANDSGYFMGLLWGCHFDTQLGDTASALRYLSMLRNIDSSNVVVKAFGRLIGIGDSLAMAETAEQRSSLHLEAADICRVMELNEESIDQAELALRESGRNIDALLFLARSHERRGSPERASGFYRQVLRIDAQNTFAAARLDSLRSKMSHL